MTGTRAPARCGRSCRRAGRRGYRSAPAARRPRRWPGALRRSVRKGPAGRPQPAAGPHVPGRIRRTAAAACRSNCGSPALREKRVGDCELAAAGARAFRRPVARPANSAAVRAPGRHRAVLAAGSARLGRLKMGRARRAQRPGGRPGVHRAGPAAPSARLLPPAPVAVTAEPAVAGAMRQLARASACQARCHDDTPIPGGGQQPGERDHRLRRVCRPGRERTGKDGQVPVELPQRPAPGSRLAHQETGAGHIQAGHRRGDHAGDPVQGCRQRPA